MTNRYKTVGVLVGALGLVSATSVQAAEPSQQELVEQIKALQSKVAELEANQTSAADVDATVADVIRDAERRSTLLANGSELTAGWQNGKFFLASEDGAFTLRPSLHFQLRNVTNYAEDDDDNGLGDDDDDIDNGFEIRRMKLGFEGNVFSKDWTYKFQWGTNRNGGDLELEDALVSYQVNEAWRVFGGQFKDPVFHEELVSSSRQLAVDRSLVNEVLGGGNTDFVQGVGFGYENGAINVAVAFHDGAGTRNTPWFDDVGFFNSDYGFGARVEYFVFGTEKAYRDFTAMNNKEDLLVFGAGADWTGGADANIVYYTVDAQWENTTGTALYGALVGESFFGYDDEDDFCNFGALVQIAQMLDKNWEVFGRYGYLDLDTTADQDTLHEITGGVNYYIYGHNAKFTADVTYLPEGSFGSSGIGYESSEDDQFVGRLQFQLVI